MPRIEAIVADLDGTLVGADYSVSPATIHALETLRAEQISLVIATGRIPQGLDELPEIAKYADVAVCCSGSIGLTSTGPLWSKRLSGAAIAEVVERSIAAGAGVAGYDGSTWHQSAGYDKRAPKGGYGAPRELTEPHLLVHASCITMSVTHESLDVLARIAHDLKGLVGVGLSTVAGIDILDITAPDIDKGVGVLQAFELAGINPLHTISFGDMPNDLPMFAVTGRAYAIGLRHADLRVADEVLPSVEHDGFAAKIAELASSRWIMPSPVGKLVGR
jgi:hypothetical protein